MDYSSIKFKNSFQPKDCVEEFNTKDNKFNAFQSGGKITSIDNENIIFSHSVYGESFLAQDNNSVFGKILKINIKTGNYQVISKGLRNTQGLVYDSDKNLILSTEHGPSGGDEINLIFNSGDKDSKFWLAISSYGEHGDKLDPKIQKLYKKYPLNKSHIKHGFIEPIIYFTEKKKIAPNQIFSFKNNKSKYSRYGFTTLANKSIYTFELNEKNEAMNLKKIQIGERIRDIVFFQNKIYLYLEDTASLGILEEIK